ncbi:T9SS type A sorting domain-containing protein [Pedobacter sp. LMG 31464]|uniref:T9SS type A sorting domain-containing protein n=1 Tax=Pedobacter planticolens TaxID=2679964 RepID=A0A923DWX5_9SPHI|nr:T9SS type A sorting domain-containing protein [Pedobacter planticolens]MBB2144170.1 T9SS type A sorting domain-containing protein [Pedobacter planticolens]
MEKLYKLFVIFVGLIAISASVYGQSEVYTPYLATDSTTSTTNYTFIDLTSTATANIDWNDESALVVKQNPSFTNYPNPATDRTTIAYTLATKAKVTLRVIDLTGKQLAVLIKQEIAAGKHEYDWELSKNNITSGMYILVLQVDNKIFSRKIIVQ